MSGRETVVRVVLTGHCEVLWCEAAGRKEDLCCGRDQVRKTESTRLRVGRQQQLPADAVGGLVSGLECWRTGAGEGALLLLGLFLVPPPPDILFEHLMS